MFPWRGDHYSRARSKYSYSNSYLIFIKLTQLTTGRRGSSSIYLVRIEATEMYWLQPPSSRPDSLPCVCCGLEVFSRTESSRRRLPFSILAWTSIGSLVWEQEAISGMVASSYFLQMLKHCNNVTTLSRLPSVWRTLSLTWTVSGSFEFWLQSF